MIEPGAAHIRRRPILVAMVAIALAAFLAIALVSSRSVAAGPGAPRLLLSHICRASAI